MTETTPNPIRVAAVQAEPEWNDLQKGVEKTIRLIKETGENGANVMGFPEVWIPGYPCIWNQSVIDNAAFVDEYFRNSLERDSEEMNRIRAACKEAGLFCVLGYSERYRGSLYIAQSFIDENGDIVHHRRNFKPTHVERAYWGDGQGESLQTVVKSSVGGGLNCWEHTQTLLRSYEYAQDVDIHVASWPLIFKNPGACFTLLCSQVVSAENRERNKLDQWDDIKSPGGGFSIIYGPTGEPLVEAPDSGKERLAKQNLDVVGHYTRPDQLSLRVNTHPAKPIQLCRGIGELSSISFPSWISSLVS
ncbi:carbon-nitrogen hydrolase [Aspergillus cavernicola]|uniref:nitrilase n=1 Tax=Aspergillus cavernicola TaxID=176166 RepID=A0ABR4I6S0_9EURO